MCMHAHISTHTHTHSYFSLVGRVVLFNNYLEQYLRGTLWTQEVKDRVVILKDKQKNIQKKKKMQGFT